MVLSSGRWPSRNQRLPWCILTVCLGVCVQQGSAQGAAAGVINAGVGETATLTAPVTVNVLTFAWYRGTGVAASQMICTYFASPPRQINGPQYTGRETGRPDGSLEIRDLLSSYTGNYTVTVTPNGESAVSATRQLMVLAWLGVWTQRTVGQGPGAEVVTAAMGQMATLTAPVTTGILVFSWYRGTVVDPSQLIIAYVVPSSAPTTGLQSTGLESVSPNGTLHIRDLRTSDSGNYTVFMTLTNATTTTGTRQLRVHELVTKPTVTCVPSQLVENRGPAEITCVTSSAAVTILWSFNSTSALPGNIIQSPNNRTLTITNVSRADSGIYQCVSMNPVSSSTSDPQTLTVAYGPEDVKIDPPGSQSLQVGGKLFLSCTVGSFPAPEYQWLLNGTDLKRPGNTYTVEKVSSQDDGNYTCVAHNTVTGLSEKASVFITVHGSPCPTPGSCWQTTLGVACGILLGAAIIVAVIAVHYERRLKQKDTTKDENMYQNPSVIKNAGTHYENVRKGREEQSANPDSAADPVYMELKHGDRATYEQIKRP